MVYYTTFWNSLFKVFKETPPFVTFVNSFLKFLFPLVMTNILHCDSLKSMLREGDFLRIFSDLQCLRNNE